MREAGMVVLLNIFELISERFGMRWGVSDFGGLLSWIVWQVHVWWVSFKLFWIIGLGPKYKSSWRVYGNIVFLQFSGIVISYEDIFQALLCNFREPNTACYRLYKGHAILADVELCEWDSISTVLLKQRTHIFPPGALKG